MKQLVKRAVCSSLKKMCICCVPHQRDRMLPYVQAEQILNRHSPDPRSSCLRKMRINEAEYDLSIIIPVYNVEQYLNRCLQSVFNQNTGYRCEVIAVNDGSTDRCAEILDSYTGNEDFRRIDQSNRGISGARNRGLQEARGRYIMFVDSDDYLPANAVEALLSAALSRDADIVQGSYSYVDQSGYRQTSVKTYDDSSDVAPNGVLAGMAWGKVYRAELWQKVSFPEDCWFEDTIITSIVTHLASRIATISDVVYCYRNNCAGITKTSVGKPKSIDTFYVLRSVMEARRELGLHTDSAFYEHLLRLMILCARRTKQEPEQVRLSMFSLFQKMIHEERCLADVTVQGQYKSLEEAIFQGDYRKFRMLCSVW